MNKPPQKKRKETLITNKDLAFVSKKIVTLKDDVPVENKIESFKIKNIEKNKLYDFLREMEFNRLLSQAIKFYGEVQEFTNQKTDIKLNSEKIDTSKYKTVKKEQDFENFSLTRNVKTK